MASSLSLRAILDLNKLIESNYIDWLKNLRKVLTQKKISYILDSPATNTIGEDATKEESVTYKM